MIKIWIDTRLSSKEEREFVEQMIVDGKSIIEIIENKTVDVALLKAFYEKGTEAKQKHPEFRGFDAFQRFSIIGCSPLENAERSLKNSFENIKNLESNRVFKYKDGSKIKTHQSFNIEHLD